MSHQPVQAKMLLNGRWEDGHERIEVRNPADPDEIVGTAVRGTAADAIRAIAAAKAAQPAWARRSFVERASFLTRRWIALPAAPRQGRCFTPARMAAFLPKASANCAASRSRKGWRWNWPSSWTPAASSRPTVGGHSSTTCHTASWFRSCRGMRRSLWRSSHVIPALLAGNAVVVKPPESCPLALVGRSGSCRRNAAARDFERGHRTIFRPGRYADHASRRRQDRLHRQDTGRPHHHGQRRPIDQRRYARTRRQ